METDEEEQTEVKSLSAHIDTMGGRQKTKTASGSLFPGNGIDLIGCTEAASIRVLGLVN